MPPAPFVNALINAAFQGDEALDALLTGATPLKADVELPAVLTAEDGGTAVAGDAGAESMPGAYLEHLTVACYRGVGPEATVTFHPGPGLTLIVGRNGSGKSSFADGLEALLTGKEGRREKGKAAAFGDGWRNLGGGTPRVTARFVVEGAGAVAVERLWPEGAELQAGHLTVRQGEAPTTLEALGWADALDEFRPFLSYPELGALERSPSGIYDQLYGVLGLEALDAAGERLVARKRAQDAEDKALKSRLAELVKEAEELTDPRGVAVHGALTAPIEDLDGIAELARGGPHGLVDGEGDAFDARRRAAVAIASLHLPEVEAFAALAAHLREAAARLAAARGASVEPGLAVVDLLDRALPRMESAPADCPVCQRPVDGALLAELRQRHEALRAATAEERGAAEALARARADAVHLVASLPAAVIRLAPECDLGADLVTALDALEAAVEDEVSAADVATALEVHGVALVDASYAVEPEAERLIAAMDEDFLKLAAGVRAWVDDRRQFKDRDPFRKAVAKANKWLDGERTRLRAQRFTPIAEDVQQTWSELGIQSSVKLKTVQLAGNLTRRRLDLQVVVDDKGTAALGVMSQGELNALAMSIFLPRMMQARSPFRFLVIDDPVQAMDPIKVDGLARTLSHVAKTRQVIVLTHDPRLREAIRRLQIEATIVEVSRNAGSFVSTRIQKDAVNQYLEDARHVVSQRHALGETVVRRVVPGLCRNAIEAACLEKIRRRRLGRGDTHEAVETLCENRSLNRLVALALFDDTTRAGDVEKHLKKKQKLKEIEALKASKRGAHLGTAVDLAELVEGAGNLCKNVRDRKRK